MPSADGNRDISLFLIFFFGLIGICLIYVMFRWLKDRLSPKITTQATVSSKRVKILRSRQPYMSGAPGWTTYEAYTYYVTFQLENRNQIELRVPKLEYAELKEGQYGILRYQGGHYIGFSGVERPSKKSKGKIIIITLAIAAALLFLWLIIDSSFLHPIPPVSAQKMTEVFQTQGYTLLNTSVTGELDQQGHSVVIGEREGVHIEFFAFDDNNAAIDMYQTLVSVINTTRRDYPYQETDEGHSNYWRYVFNGENLYSTAMYVGNTAVYAACDTENVGQLNTILRQIGYLTESSMRSIIPASLMYLFLTLCLIPIVLVCRHSLKLIIYRSAGMTEKSLAKFNKEHIREYARTNGYSRLIKQSPRPKQTRFWIVLYQLALLPEFVAIVLSLFGLFSSVFQNILANWITVVIVFSFITALAGAILGRLLYRKNS